MADFCYTHVLLLLHTTTNPPPTRFAVACIAKAFLFSLSGGVGAHFLKGPREGDQLDPGRLFSSKGHFMAIRVGTCRRTDVRHDAGVEEQ